MPTESLDKYQFWGIVHSAGEVTPENLDYPIYYTEDTIQNNLDGLLETPVILSHVRQDDGGVEDYELGEVTDYSLLQDNLFVLNTIYKDQWDEFVDNFENENGNIGPTWNTLIDEIDAGNLALSAGLTGATTAPTEVHQDTVISYGWKEVSVVPAPASPGAWAWGCDDGCKTVFQQTMTEEQEVEIEAEASEGGDGGEDEVVQTEPSIPETVQMGDDEYKLVPTEEVEQGGCNCETESLESELEQARSERDQYKELVQEFRQTRKEEAVQEMKDLNQKLSEDKAYDEEELDQMAEDMDVQAVRQQADMMERLIPEQTETIQSSEEDLSGASETKGPDNDEAEEALNQASQDLFGEDLDSVLQGIDEKYEE